MRQKFGIVFVIFGNLCRCCGLKRAQFNVKPMHAQDVIKAT